MILGLAGRVRRLGVYFFYDPAGVVDEYVIHFLQAMNADFTELIVVVNGRLSAEGRDAFSRLEKVTVIVRPNSGFDVWAYKTAIDHVGWGRLSDFDEMVMMNFTIVGPVNSFADMFEEMNSRDIDFWGITVHNGASFDPWGTLDVCEVPPHLQSHFIAVRRSLFEGEEFRRYWDDMGPILSYVDAVSKHEAFFTERFANAGYRWESYVDTRDSLGLSHYPLFNDPVDLIENRRCPVFKRKMFFIDAGAYLDENSNYVARALLDYLESSGRYDVQMLMRHLIRSANQHDLRIALNLHEIPDGVVAANDAATAAVIVLGADDHPLLSVIRSMRVPIDVLTVGDGHRDPLLRAVELSAPYELVCVVDATVVDDAFPVTVGAAAAEEALDMVLGSAEQIESIIGFFGSRPETGMLSPLPPQHGWYYGAIGHGWSEDFAAVTEVLDALGSTVPVSAAKAPTAPTLGAFWARPAALAVLGNLPDDVRVSVSRLGTRAQRRLLPLVVQHSGFLPRFVATPARARNHLTNAMHYIGELNREFGAGEGERFSTFVHRLSSISFLAQYVDAPALFAMGVYWDRGRGFSEADKTIIPYADRGASQRDVRIDLDVPDDVIAVRLDPVEGMACACGEVLVDGDTVFTVRAENASRIGELDVFVDGDPRFIVEGPAMGGSRLSVVFREIHFLLGEKVVLESLLSLAEPPSIRRLLAERLRRLRRR
ncbi:rhamnan synthesis F family protein [Luethyella okanaganae]|uniref:Rhamnan synthesis F family protein n=1 Tax=Luethyella okanaganae TaxID=69372 RepID=A0ABW1VJG8_9MICO